MMKNIFGVPCSKLKERIKDVEVNCTSEEEAMALAVGTWLAGKEATVYMQNSGLCRCLDIVLSLYKPYSVPVPKLILSLRRHPEHHLFVGEATQKLLDIMGYNNMEIVDEED